MKIAILLTVILLSAAGMHGQVLRPDIAIKPRNERVVAYFPYSSVQVIDNRPDTTKIYTEETGIYPPHSVAFTGPAAEAIKKYIYASVHDSQKGKGELLINIEQLGITNIIHCLKYYKRSGVIAPNPVRKYLQFQATAWYKNEQGHYNKLLTIKKGYTYYGYNDIGSTVCRLLNDCIRVMACSDPDKGIGSRQQSSTLRRLLKDTASFQFAKGENNVPFEQININVRNRWKDYPVVKESSLPAGFYYLFDDFKYNRIAPAAIHMVLNEKDSLYHLTGNDSLIHRKPHWGVFDGINWYMNLSDSSYCKLNRQGDTFAFYIPSSMPDMYALLSMQENYESGTASSPITASDNIISAMVAALISSTVQHVITTGENRSMIRRITKEGLKHNFRYCTINMDNGDVMYNDH